MRKLKRLCQSRGKCCLAGGGQARDDYERTHSRRLTFELSGGEAVRSNDGLGAIPTMENFGRQSLKILFIGRGYKLCQLLVMFSGVEGLTPDDIRPCRI